MILSLGRFALYVLGLFIFYGPFAYKSARDKGFGHIASFGNVILLYLLFYLWLGGGATALRGIGLVFDRPSQSCGSGCIEEGESHWESPEFSLIALGVGMMCAGWFIGKGAERVEENALSRASIQRAAPCHPGPLPSGGPASDGARASALLRRIDSTERLSTYKRRPRCEPITESQINAIRFEYHMRKWPIPENLELLTSGEAQAWLRKSFEGPCDPLVIKEPVLPPE